MSDFQQYLLREIVQVVFVCLLFLLVRKGGTWRWAAAGVLAAAGMIFIPTSGVYPHLAWHYLALLMVGVALTYARVSFFRFALVETLVAVMLVAALGLEGQLPWKGTQPDPLVVVGGATVGIPPGGGQQADPDFDATVAQPAFVSSHPRVLFDEAHDNFHTSGGRYKAFADLITSDGYRLTPNHEQFTPPLLAGFDILVIAGATAAGEVGLSEVDKSAFTVDECTAVEDWVKGGGSLLLVTDHEPWGSPSDLLARRFGVDMSNATVSDRANQSGRGLLFTRENHTLGDHAITNGRDASERVERVLTFRGQSLKGPPASVPFLILSPTAVEELAGGQISAAGRAQGIALVQGKGRVVVTGEAAQLTAQVVGSPPQPAGMNIPGCDNRQMVLNIMHWLSGLTD